MFRLFQLGICAANGIICIRKLGIEQTDTELVNGAETVEEYSI
jgi:hypothetical protein